MACTKRIGGKRGGGRRNRTRSGGRKRSGGRRRSGGTGIGISESWAKYRSVVRANDRTETSDNVDNLASIEAAKATIKEYESKEDKVNQDEWTKNLSAFLNFFKELGGGSTASTLTKTTEMTADASSKRNTATNLRAAINTKISEHAADSTKPLATSTEEAAAVTAEADAATAELATI